MSLLRSSLVVSVAATLASCATQRHMESSVTPTVTRAPYGRLPDGRAVDVFTLANPSGVVVRAMTYGAIITAVRTPDRNGHLEDITLERDLAHEKARLEPRYADLVYDGLWFSPLKQALDAFVDESQRFVTGEVRLRCEVPGRCLAVGRRSEVGLYDYGLATYEAADRFRHDHSEGFVRLWGLGVETWAARQALSGEPRRRDERQ